MFRKRKFDFLVNFDLWFYIQLWTVDCGLRFNFSKSKWNKNTRLNNFLNKHLNRFLNMFFATFFDGLFDPFSDWVLDVFKTLFWILLGRFFGRDFQPDLFSGSGWVWNPRIWVTFWVLWVKNLTILC